MADRIAVFSPEAMDDIRRGHRESERENNNLIRDDGIVYHGPARVFFQITDQTRNIRNRYLGISYSLDLYEDTGSPDRWVLDEVVEVVSDADLSDDIIYEGVVIGHTIGTLYPVVAVAANAGGRELEIPIAYCDVNGELAYYYICATVIDWRMGRCNQSSSSSSSS